MIESVIISRIVCCKLGRPIRRQSQLKVDSGVLAIMGNISLWAAAVAVIEEVAKSPR